MEKLLAGIIDFFYHSIPNAPGVPGSVEISSSMIGAMGGILAALLGALVAAMIGVLLSRYGRAARTREDWALVFDLIDKIHEDPMSSNALMLLDYESYPIDFPGDKKLLVSRSDVLSCLRVPPETITFTEEEKYIRDCFDVLFVNATKLILIHSIGYIKMKDMDAVFGFFFSRMHDQREFVVFEAYLKGFFYNELYKFIVLHRKIYKRKYAQETMIKDEVLPPEGCAPFVKYAYATLQSDAT